MLLHLQAHQQRRVSQKGVKSETPPLWENAPGFATHVKDVEVEFKELEFIDPSRMVRLAIFMSKIMLYA